MDVESYLRTKFDEERKVWYGPKTKPFYDKDVSVGTLVFYSLCSNPKNVLTINDTEGVSLTNAEVLQRSIRVALGLKAHGVGENDTVGLLASNSANMMPIAFGSLFIAAPFHGLDVSFTKEAIVHSWSKTKPKVVFCNGALYDLVKEARDEIGLDYVIYTVNDHKEGVKSIDEILEPKPLEQLFRPTEISNGDQTGVILCSSGTTGLSKAVGISHRRLTSMLSIIVDNCEDKILSFSSLYWFSGVVHLLFCGVSGATYLVISEAFTPSRALELIDKYKVTKTMLPPRNMALILDCPDVKTKSMLSLKTINCSGSKLPSELRTRIKKYLNPSCQIFYGYAATEVGLVAFTMSDKYPDSSGILFPNIEVKILDENGNNVGPNEDGEICVNNGHLWPGYFEDKKATEEVYNREEGWYHSGDKGHFDENGYLFIVDRIKEIMKCKGYHVSPSEIESVILEIPDVVEVCVCGVPDLINMNLPSALIVRTKGSSLKEEEVVKHVQEKLPYYKHLTGGVFFVDELPRTPSGKILRRVVSVDAEKLYNALL
ncbi:hypothetical protein ACFFRR_002194 [Megaselia abdita]